MGGRAARRGARPGEREWPTPPQTEEAGHGALLLGVIDRLCWGRRSGSCFVRNRRSVRRLGLWTQSASSPAPARPLAAPQHPAEGGSGASGTPRPRYGGPTISGSWEASIVTSRSTGEGRRRSTAPARVRRASHKPSTSWPAVAARTGGVLSAQGLPYRFSIGTGSTGSARSKPKTLE